MKMRQRWALILLTASVNASTLGQTYRSETTPKISNLPATFMGTLPCADCPGIIHQINLLSNHRFASRMIYQERNRGFGEHGRWELARDGTMLILRTAKGRAEKFAVVDGNTLRQLDADGHEIPSGLNYDLKRSAEFAPLETPDGRK
jgi:copper homeostasis protein (lipoprotein)